MLVIWRARAMTTALSIAKRHERSLHMRSCTVTRVEAGGEKTKIKVSRPDRHPTRQAGGFPVGAAGVCRLKFSGDACCEMFKV